MAVNLENQLASLSAANDLQHNVAGGFGKDVGARAVQERPNEIGREKGVRDD